jgi:hypothetical protein
LVLLAEFNAASDAEFDVPELRLTYGQSTSLWSSKIYSAFMLKRISSRMLACKQDHRATPEQRLRVISELLQHQSVDQGMRKSLKFGEAMLSTTCSSEDKLVYLLQEESNFTLLAEWFGDADGRLTLATFAKQDSNFQHLAMSVFKEAVNKLVVSDAVVAAIQHPLAKAVVKDAKQLLDIVTLIVH